MILSSLAELARSEHLLDNADYEPKPVAWILSVGEGGHFIDATPTAAEDGRGKARAKIMEIPRRKGRTVAAVADFAVDKSEYVLGVEPDGKRAVEELQIRRSLFRQEIADAAREVPIPPLLAVEAFLANDTERDRAANAVAAAKYASNDLFAFEFEGRFVHDLPEVKRYFSRLRRATQQGNAQCLVCGSSGSVAKKHPSIQLPGGTTSGVALVSFNSDAFESYGLSGNGNAPVCQDCADAYTTALKRLLTDRYPDPTHPGRNLAPRFVRLSSDTTAVFWSDRPFGILDLLTNYFAAPTPDSVKGLLESPRSGRASGALTNRFYCLILTGGQGRAILRGLHTGTVDQIETNLAAYFESVDIGSPAPLPLTWLMRSLVLQGKLENLPPALVTDVFLAIIFGRRFPQTLLARAVSRCRAERKVTRERAAILRAFIIRNTPMEVTVGLDISNPSEAYRLGRLMALLERIQGAAQNNPNKTIVDRYYGAASTRPGTVFPRLIASAQHHLSKLTRGLAAFYQTELGDVVNGLSTFPATLSLENQGLFALGYYHQRSFRKPAPATTQPSPETTSD
ncbi:MAG: type I-C CRISPR-associated protein Cas8c/Csd1 [Bryobacteraceae bacterium]